MISNSDYKFTHLLKKYIMCLCYILTLQEKITDKSNEIVSRENEKIRYSLLIKECKSKTLRKRGWEATSVVQYLLGKHEPQAQVPVSFF